MYRIITMRKVLIGNRELMKVFKEGANNRERKIGIYLENKDIHMHSSNTKQTECST